MAPTPPVPTPLPEDVPTLQALVRELLAEVATLRQTVARQQERIDALTRQLYGRSSERSTPRPAPAPPPAPVPTTRPTPQPRPTNPGHGRQPLPAHLPRERIEHDLTAAEQICPGCGHGRVRIGAEVSEQLDYRPASLYVVEHVRHTYACPACSRTADPADAGPATITTASVPATPLPKGLSGPGLLAQVVVSKFADHLPLYRQADIFARQGVALARSTLGDWLAVVADLLQPLVTRLADRVRQSRVLQTDDTPVPVQAPGTQKTKTGHLWAYLGDADHPYVVFDYTPTYSGEGPRQFLGDYAGFLQADALQQYNALFVRPPPRPTEVGCWAHARRKFYDARGSEPVLADEALTRIRQLYEVERAAPDLPDADRVALRQRDARPVADAFFAWLENLQPQALPKSPFGQAVRYALAQRAALLRYLEHGFLAIDNNASERALRAVAVGRKNWLFAGSDAGGQTAAVLYSLVGTCRRLAVEPWAYLRDVLARWPTLPAEPRDELLPERWQKARAPTTA